LVQITTFICDGEGGCQQEVSFKFNFKELQEGVRLVALECNECQLPYDKFLEVDELKGLRDEIERLSMRLRDGEITSLAYDLRVKDIKAKQKHIYGAHKKKYAKELE